MSDSSLTGADDGAVILASLRLPVTVKRDEIAFRFESSTGGLATGLAAVHERASTRWIGWPGLPSDEAEDGRDEIERELDSRRCRPVWLTRDEIEHFYDGYANAQW